MGISFYLCKNDYNENSIIDKLYYFQLLYKKKSISAYLNIPYLIWILFATYLTLGIYLLN